MHALARLQSSTCLEIAALLLLAACGSRAELPEVTVELPRASHGVEWLPGLEENLPVLEIDRRGEVTIDGESFLVDEGQAGAALRERLEEISKRLEVEGGWSGPVRGSTARALILIVDTNAPFTLVERVLAMMCYQGIQIGHLAIGVSGEDGELQRLPVYQVSDVGISCGPDVREVLHVEWHPKDRSSSLLLELPVSSYSGTSGRGPKEIQTLPAATGVELLDVLSTWRELHTQSWSWFAIERSEAALWSDYIQLLDWCHELGIEGIGAMYVSD